MEGLLLLKDSDKWSELLQSVMTAFESYVKSYPIFGARLLFYKFQATGDRDLLKKGWEVRSGEDRKARAGRKERSEGVLRIPQRLGSLDKQGNDSSVCNVFALLTSRSLSRRRSPSTTEWPWRQSSSRPNSACKKKKMALTATETGSSLCGMLRRSC